MSARTPRSHQAIGLLFITGAKRWPKVRGFPLSQRPKKPPRRYELKARFWLARRSFATPLMAPHKQQRIVLCGRANHTEESKNMATLTEFITL